MVSVKTVRTLSFWPWLEKIWILFDTLQIFGLFWNLCQAWSVPHLYVRWTRFLVWFNLDYFSTTSMGALMGRSNFLNVSKWGQMDGYLEYTIFFVAPIFAVFVLYKILQLKVSQYGTNSLFTFRMWIDAFLLFMAQLLYVPICLAISRIFICENTAISSFLSADPNIQCLNFFHMSSIMICTLAALPLYIGLPIYVYMIAEKSVVYTFTEDHEIRLIGYEFLYMFDLDNNLIRNHLWNIVSFRRSGAWHRFHVLSIKAILIFLLTVLRSHLYVQSLLCFIVISAFTIKMFINLPYRLFSSNVVLLTCFSGLCVNFLFGLLNTSELESALTVGSTQSLMLAAINFFVAFIVSIMIAFDVFNPYCKWPADVALHKINKGPISIDVKEWISTIKRANVILVDCFQASNLTVDIAGLELVTWDLRQCWLQAKSHSSVFELVISEVLDKLLLMHAQRSPTALRKLSPQWDNEYKFTVSKLKAKARLYSMMNKKKRIILYSLMALRFIQGGRKLSKSDIQTRNEIHDLRRDSDRFFETLEGSNYEEQKKARICRSLIEKWDHHLNFANSAMGDKIHVAFSDKDVCEWLEYRNKLRSVDENYEGFAVTHEGNAVEHIDRDA